jgi:hypothetical protein
MNFNAVESILESLPSSFKRLGPNYDNWQNTQSAVLARMTGAIDSLMAQYSFTGATGNWLNAWGDILGVLRRSETDAIYHLCITGTMLAWRGTVPGIEKYINEARQIPCTVTEAFPNVGWNLVVQPGYTLSASQISQLPVWLSFVRPAGVPYAVQAYNGSGGVLSTGNFISNTRFPGSWLRLTGGNPSGLVIPASTNNSVSTLPTTFFTDPTLNPSLPAG